MPSRPVIAPRRHPQQARSRRMVSVILDAAALVFVDAGYEAATTNQVAERAGVSIGSLYQFFPNKAALLAALQAQWTERLGAALDAALSDAAERELGEVIDGVLDVHASLNADPPGLLGVLLTAPPLTHDGETVRAAIQERLEAIYALRVPQLSAARRAAVARMAIHITNGLYALSPRAGAMDAAVRAEVRAALLAYLAPIVRDAP